VERRFATLAISFWPYLIPFSITIEDAAAPHSSLAFMFWGAGIFVFPLTLPYTVIKLHRLQGERSERRQTITETAFVVPERGESQ
jgi:cytochrome bd ubiquinol oxidase subunit II